MRPILFNENATTFTTNGEGRLDCISCIVTEERNGMYELEMKIGVDATHADQIKANSIIVVIPSDGASLQPFRVYRITKPIDGVFSVYAQHISYQLSMIPTMPFSITASASACNDTLQGLKNNAAENCPFTFWTDVTTASPYKQDVPSSIRSRLGGVEGSVLDQFGGEYEWDGYTVKLHDHRGVTVPAVSLRYGKNITDINQEANIANTITGICPYWMSSDGETIVTLPEKVVEGQYASQYPFKRTVPYDFSNKWEEAPTESQLRTAAQAYVNSSGIGLPVISIQVSFVALWQTEEYKEVAPLQHVKLCDLVNIEFEKFGIEETAKVVKTIYDVLGEKYESIEIGSIRTNLGTTINDQNNATTAQIKEKFGQVGTEIDNATAWLTSGDGYVVAVKNSDGTWKELLFLDTDDMSTATNVLRVNQNGIGFSSNGVAGPYTQAWTLDGKLVIGGTNVPSLTVYDNNNQILFQVSRSGVIWDVENSSMSANGTLDMKNGTIVETLENGATKYVMTIDIHGFNYSVIQNNTVLASASVTPALINEYYGLMMSSNTHLGIQATYDIYETAGRRIELKSASNMILDVGGNLALKRPGLADVNGFTGALVFYDGQSVNRELNFYKGICYYAG